MKRISLKLESKAFDALDAYCRQNDVTISNAIRKFICEGIEQYQNSKCAKNGTFELLVNQKRGIRASIESLLILRSLIPDKETIDDIKKRAEVILEDGWIFENDDS